MKGRRESRSSRSGLIKEKDRELSQARKLVSDVLLVCELLLFITIAALQGGHQLPQSSAGVKPTVRRTQSILILIL